MAYKVIKWRKGNAYLYEQETYRKDGKVKTRNIYIGRYVEMKKESDKYNIKDALFDEINGILKNKLGIIDNEQLGVIENEHLIKAYNTAIETYSETHSFTDNDIKFLHKLFLGKIFKWAGNYRNVDISSSGIRYCHAIYINDSMKEFSKLLSKLTPFNSDMSKNEIARKIAEIHGELIVIHPFRDGNGRTTRLLCDLLLIQAGKKPLDTRLFYDKSFLRKYHSAIREVWHNKIYSDLEEIFFKLID